MGRDFNLASAAALFAGGQALGQYGQEARKKHDTAEQYYYELLDSPKFELKKEFANTEFKRGMTKATVRRMFRELSQEERQQKYLGQNLPLPENQAAYWRPILGVKDGQPVTQSMINYHTTEMGIDYKRKRDKERQKLDYYKQLVRQGIADRRVRVQVLRDIATLPGDDVNEIMNDPVAGPNLQAYAKEAGREFIKDTYGDWTIRGIKERIGGGASYKSQATEPPQSIIQPPTPQQPTSGQPQPTGSQQEVDPELLQMLQQISPEDQQKMKGVLQKRIGAQTEQFTPPGTTMTPGGQEQLQRSMGGGGQRTSITPILDKMSGKNRAKLAYLRMGMMPRKQIG